MLSQSTFKLIRALKNRKQRQKNKLFVAEGPKLVNDLINKGCPLEHLYALPSFIALHQKKLDAKGVRYSTVSAKDLQRAAHLKTPNEVIALCNIIDHDPSVDHLKARWSIALDNVNDPGNLGTIVRLAHWLNIEYVFCSPETVDIYNSKAIQATMGAVADVKVCYRPLELFLKEMTKHVPVYAANLKGQSIYETTFTNSGILLMGSESHGISTSLNKFVNYEIMIPRMNDLSGPESLNVATAAAIIGGELLRNGLLK